MHDLQRYLIMQMWANEPGRSRFRNEIKTFSPTSEKLALGDDLSLKMGKADGSRVLKTQNTCDFNFEPHATHSASRKRQGKGTKRKLSDVDMK